MKRSPVVFIGHLPASYLLGRLIQRRVSAPLWPLLLGGVAPDFDLLYFYTWGQRQVVHHAYFTHWPLFWAAFYLVGHFVLRALRRPALPFALFVIGCLLHMVLDTPVGQIRWLAPWSMHDFFWWSVPAGHHPYVLNFVFHPSFLIEILICLIAAAVWLLPERFPR